MPNPEGPKQIPAEVLRGAKLKLDQVYKAAGVPDIDRKAHMKAPRNAMQAEATVSVAQKAEPIPVFERRNQKR